MNFAFVTLLTRDSYLAGTLVLHHSLRATNSKHEFIVMVTPELPIQTRLVLTKRGIKIREIESLFPSEDISNLTDIRFKDTWTKLRAFELVEFDRIVLLDSDMLVLRNMDELLEYDLPGPDWIAAAHACACNPRKFPHYPADWTPANCAYTPLKSEAEGFPPASKVTQNSPRPYALLNSGTVLLQPSEALSQKVYAYLTTSPLVATFTFPDQDLLAALFKGKWKPLPYVYNALKTLRIVHEELWRDRDIRCLHYILAEKPWMQPRGSGAEYETVNSWWWDKYDELEVELKESDPHGWTLVESQVVKV